MSLFYLRGLTPAEAHTERVCHLQVALKGPGYRGFTRRPLGPSGWGVERLYSTGGCQVHLGFSLSPLAAEILPGSNYRVKEESLK